MRKIRNEQGFTLMELMIVVAIIAVLAAIALPMVTGAVDKARDAAEIADVRSVAGSIAVYAANEDLNNNSNTIGTQFLAVAENKNSVPNTVTVAANGTVTGKENIRTKKVGLEQGKQPYINFGGSLMPVKDYSTPAATPAAGT